MVIPFLHHLRYGRKCDILDIRLVEVHMYKLRTLVSV